MLKKFKEIFFPYYWKEKEGFYEKVHVLNEHSYLIKEIFPNDLDELMKIQQLVYNGKSPWSKSAFLSELYAYTLHFYIAIWFEKRIDRKSTRLNSSHVSISYAVFCLKKKK